MDASILHTPLPFPCDSIFPSIKAQFMGDGAQLITYGSWWNLISYFYCVIMQRMLASDGPPIGKNILHKTSMVGMVGDWNHLTSF